MYLRDVGHQKQQQHKGSSFFSHIYVLSALNLAKIEDNFLEGLNGSHEQYHESNTWLLKCYRV